MILKPYLPLDPPENEPPVPFDPPTGCTAVVAVAEDGTYIMLKKPNLWMFEAEPAPQDNGFGDEFDLPPGVYWMRFSYHPHKDWETGWVDDWEFIMQEHKLLWSQDMPWWRKLWNVIMG